MSDIQTDSLAYHEAAPHGKLTIVPTKPCETGADLALAYTPGVAEPCLAIEKDPEKVYDYTSKGNLVAIVTNGTAVLGLGNLGPAASKPVMEGKAVLFKRFADVDAIDIELDAQSIEDIVSATRRISPGFGGINLEDIKAPECFEVEVQLRKALDIPVFHDDQHGTAIVIAAALMNALEINGKRLEELRFAFNGAGAAAIATVRYLRELGVGRDQITVCDRKGVIYAGRPGNESNPYKMDLAVNTEARTLEESVCGADVFIGLSVGNALSNSMLRSMEDDPIVFALANPTPEIGYKEARFVRRDAIVATGRSDTPNQVNNVLAFPYIFRAALDVRAREINVPMMRAASTVLAELARTDLYHPFGPDFLVPNPFDPRLFVEVPVRIAQAAIESGVARRPILSADYRALLIARSTSRPHAEEAVPV